MKKREEENKKKDNPPREKEISCSCRIQVDTRFHSAHRHDHWFAVVLAFHSFDVITGEMAQGKKV